MNKELENAIINIESYLRPIVISSSPSWKLIKQYLTPPTSDEVCKALSEHLKHTVITRKNKHGITFNYDETKQTIIRKNYDLLNIKLLLPTHLTTLICRFYEGLEK